MGSGEVGNYEWVGGVATVWLGRWKGGGWDVEEGRNARLTAPQSTVLRLVGLRVQSARMVAHEGSLWSAVVSLS